MTLLRPAIILAVLCILLYGCTAHQYIPSPHYVQLHKTKGEFVTNIYVFPAGFQVGYTVTDHFFVFANGYDKMRNPRPSGIGTKESGGQETFLGTSSEINFGGGYFTGINKMIFEVMAGGGIGKMDYSHTIDLVQDYHFSAEGRKANVFIEPVLGIKVDDYLELGVFSKFNAVRYSSIKSSIGVGEKGDIDKDDLAFASHNTVDVLFLEPGFFVTAGWPNVKFNIQIGGVNELAGAEIRNNSFLFRSGVSVKIGGTSEK
jgi:hypothetical protein